MHRRRRVDPPLCRRYWGRRRQLNSVCNACAKMEDNFDPGTAEKREKEGRGMRNILGDDVAFVRSLEPETKERALRGDGSAGWTDARTESGAPTRVWSKYQTLPPPTLPHSHSHGTWNRTHITMAKGHPDGAINSAPKRDVRSPVLMSVSQARPQHPGVQASYAVVHLLPGGRGCSTQLGDVLARQSPFFFHV